MSLSWCFKMSHRRRRCPISLLCAARCAVFWCPLTRRLSAPSYQNQSSRFSRFGGFDFEVSIVTDAVALAFLSHCLMIADPSCRSRWGQLDVDLLCSMRSRCTMDGSLVAYLTLRRNSFLACFFATLRMSTMADHHLHLHWHLSIEAVHPCFRLS